MESAAGRGVPARLSRGLRGAAHAVRRFHYPAFIVGLAVALWGTIIAWNTFYDEKLRWAEGHQGLFWATLLAVFTLAGFLVGLFGQRIGFWESLVMTLVVTAVAYVHLEYSLPRLLGFGAAHTLSAWDLVEPPGLRHLGDQWQRLLGLVAAGAFPMAVVGGSLAFLFASAEGGRATGFEWFISKRHLFREGTSLLSLTAVVAILGIGLGVAALVAVTAVMSGYQEDIRERILSTNAHLIVQKYGIDFAEYDEVGKKALGVPGVLAASPFAFNEAMLSDGERGLGVLIKGVAPDSAGKVTGIEENLCRVQGNTCERVAAGETHLAEWLAPTAGVPSIIVGAELYKKIGRPVGSSVLLTTPIGIAGARGNAPRRIEFKLTGVFRSGMHEFDSRLAYVELSAAQRLLGLGPAVSGVELRLSDPDAVDTTARQVLRAIGNYPYRTTDWRNLNQAIFKALNLQKVVMFLVLALIVVVGAFNIASTLFMAVVEKAREIAVLKSMGARDGAVMKIFVTQGWVVAAIGTILGLVLGFAVCLLIEELAIGIAADVYMVEKLTVRIWPDEILVTILATLVISHLATLHPALKAARQRPVDAMRYE